jgi:hypothetical protein
MPAKNQKTKTQKSKTKSGCNLSRRARLTAGFLRSVCVAARQLEDRVPWRYPGGHRRFEAAFFCLLFFAAAKKSRCRPAQGQRVTHQYEFADASQKPKPKNQKPKKSKTRHGDCVADKKSKQLAPKPSCTAQ